MSIITILTNSLSIYVLIGLGILTYEQYVVRKQVRVRAYWDTKRNQRLTN